VHNDAIGERPQALVLQERWVPLGELLSKAPVLKEYPVAPELLLADVQGKPVVVHERVVVVAIRRVVDGFRAHRLDGVGS
jgi:hypothetical protein